MANPIVEVMRNLVVIRLQFFYDLVLGSVLRDVVLEFSEE